MEKVQPGVFKEGEHLYTLNAIRGEKVYGEPLISREGGEFRRWDPDRSKAAAAIKKGLKPGIERSDEVLYLGAASGTTVSHLSDVLSDGFIVAVEYSEEVARDLVELAEKRENIAPVIADARKVEEYKDLVEEVDLVYQDISQRDQAEIFLKNCRRFLKEGGVGLMAVKARSVSSTREPEAVFEEVREKLSEELEIRKETRLEPFEKDHLFLKLEKK